MTSESAKKSLQLVIKLNKGISCCLRDSKLIFSAGNTSLYTHNRLSVKGDKQKIVNNSQNKNRGCRSACNLKNKKVKHSRVKIKLRCTFSACGASAPVFIAVSGLRENELKLSDDKLNSNKGACIMCIKGLWMHGAADLLNKEVGCVLFCQLLKGKKYSSKEARLTFYQDEILRSYVNKMRKLKFLLQEEGDPILPEMKAVSQSDRVIDEVNSIVTECSLAKKTLRNNQ